MDSTIESAQCPVRPLKINRIIVSPPFGTYLNFKQITPVIGTFTYQRRPGLYRQALKTFRLYEGGYINKIGLRNKGLPNLVPNAKAARSILSIASLNTGEWALLAQTLDQLKAQYGYRPLALELNLSCPNVNEKLMITPEELRRFSAFDVILKLPPTDKCLDYIAMATANGVNHFHLCNTLPTPKGGVSGRLLKAVSLSYVKEAKAHFGDKISVVGGGGIYTIDDAKAYLDAGADYLSLASVAFNPRQFYNILRYLEQ